MLPLEVLEEILLNVHPHQVVCVCRLVCHEWKEVVDSDSLWRERCRREGYQTHDATKLPEDWRLFYFLCKKRRNLIKNPGAEDKFNGWQIMKNGGDQWNIESGDLNNTATKYFVTSYATCMKSQLIDLEEEGYRPSLMDAFQPAIVISDWYAPRWDCGSEYEICVELLNQKKKPIRKFSPDAVIFQQWNDQKWNQMNVVPSGVLEIAPKDEPDLWRSTIIFVRSWQIFFFFPMMSNKEALSLKMTHVFKNYGPGVRYIRFIHGGKDTQFWAGWYGIRVTNSSVEICPSVDR
ncbi:F-box only protein 6-like isoform X3 [Oncorhynchus keta]|nr:F-box only protein 6-like isoform X3 [Oncorhynchus keta]XP_052338187.1 F-box only protein 6-like isoform X3 [Oncorhynchus keta]